MKRSLWPAGLACLVALGTLACSSAASPAPAVSLKVQLSWAPSAQFTGMIVADAKGFYEEEGLDVELLPGGPNVVPLQVVANGGADVGLTSVLELLAARDKDLPLQAVAQLDQLSALVLVTRQDSGLDEAADLDGKRIGLWLGGDEYEFYAMARQLGNDPEGDYQIVNQSFTMDQFINGELDATSAMSFDQLLVLTSQPGFSRDELNIIDYNDFGTVNPRGVVVATEAVVAEKADALARFLRATVRGWEFTFDNQTQALDELMKVVPAGDYTRDHQEASINEMQRLMLPDGFAAGDLGRIDQETFTRAGEVALEYDVIAAPPDDAVYVTSVYDASKS